MAGKLFHSYVPCFLKGGNGAPIALTNNNSYGHPYIVNVLRGVSTIDCLGRTRMLVVSRTNCGRTYYISLCRSDSTGIGLPARNDLMRVSACFGRCRGTSWPAPLTVTKSRPLYPWLQPPTCLNTEKVQNLRTEWRTDIYPNNQVYWSGLTKIKCCFIKATGMK